MRQHLDVGKLKAPIDIHRLMSIWPPGVDAQKSLNSKSSTDSTDYWLSKCSSATRGYVDLMFKQIFSMAKKQITAVWPSSRVDYYRTPPAQGVGNSLSNRERSVGRLAPPYKMYRHNWRKAYPVRYSGESAIVNATVAVVKGWSC